MIVTVAVAAANAPVPFGSRQTGVRCPLSCARIPVGGRRSAALTVLQVFNLEEMFFA